MPHRSSALRDICAFIDIFRYKNVIHMDNIAIFLCEPVDLIVNKGYNIRKGGLVYDLP